MCSFSTTKQEFLYKYRLKEKALIFIFWIRPMMIVEHQLHGLVLYHKLAAHLPLFRCAAS